MRSAAAVPAVLVATLVAGGVAPTFARPPAGVDVDETVTVSVAPMPPGPCLSTAFDGVVVIVGRAALDATAATSGSDPQADGERLRQIAARRAAALRAAAGGDADRFGCAVVPPAALGDALYLVGDLLERGQATVVRPGAANVEAAVQIRYAGFRCGPHCGRGSILFSVVNGASATPFVSVPWWVA